MQLSKKNQRKLKKRDIRGQKNCLTIVSGIGGTITDFSMSETRKFLAISSTNGFIRVYSIEMIFEKKDLYYFHKCEKFYATSISISNSGKKVVLARANDYHILIYKIHPKGKLKPNGKKVFFSKVQEFKKNLHFDDILQLSYLEKQCVIITCSKGSDTNIKVWSTKGELLKQQNTNFVKHYDCQITHNRQFLILGTWIPVSTIFKINFKQDTFQDVNPIMPLTGHKGGILRTSVSDDLKCAVTYSKHGTLMVWDTDVRYKD